MWTSILRFCGLEKSWPQITAEEVRHHCHHKSLWIVSGNSVYNVTDVIQDHPGGEGALLRRGGGMKDCAEDYGFHSRYARREWELFKIGEISHEERMRLFGESETSSVAQSSPDSDTGTTISWLSVLPNDSYPTFSCDLRRNPSRASDSSLQYRLCGGGADESPEGVTHM